MRLSVAMTIARCPDNSTSTLNLQIGNTLSQIQAQYAVGVHLLQVWLREFTGIRNTLRSVEAKAQVSKGSS